jgi:aquaporin Z
MMRSRRAVHLGEWAAEGTGTSFVLFCTLTTIYWTERLGPTFVRGTQSTGLRLVVMGAVIAASAGAVAYSPVGRLSGAHLNPAVTVAFWLQRRVRPIDLVGYVMSQLTGAVVGVAVARLVWGRVLASPAIRWGVVSSQHRWNTLAAGATEVLVSTIFIGTVIAMLSHRRTARFTPPVVATVVTVMVWLVAPYTGVAFNPARGLGSAALSGDFGFINVYVTAPVVGAALAVGLWALTGRRALTASIYHDPRYPSTTRCELCDHDQELARGQGRP